MAARTRRRLRAVEDSDDEWLEDEHSTPMRRRQRTDRQEMSDDTRLVFAHQIAKATASHRLPWCNDGRVADVGKVVELAGVQGNRGQMWEEEGDVDLFPAIVGSMAGPDPQDCDTIDKLRIAKTISVTLHGSVVRIDSTSRQVAILTYDNHIITVPMELAHMAQMQTPCHARARVSRVAAEALIGLLASTEETVRVVFGRADAAEQTATCMAHVMEEEDGAAGEAPRTTVPPQSTVSALRQMGIRLAEARIMHSPRGPNRLVRFVDVTLEHLRHDDSIRSFLMRSLVSITARGVMWIVVE